jgi:hypothetical protein
MHREGCEVAGWIDGYECGEEHHMDIRTLRRTPPICPAGSAGEGSLCGAVHGYRVDIIEMPLSIFDPAAAAVSSTAVTSRNSARSR